MKASSLRLRPLAAAILCSMIAPLALQAQTTATTDPVGFITTNFAGSGDSFGFVPFKRTPEYAGIIQSAAGTNGSVLTPAGTPSLGNFAYTPPTQPKKYYVYFTSGAKIGFYYSVTANTSGTLTVNTAGDDLSGVANSLFQLIPYDTLGSIFPGGAGVNPSPGHAGFQQQTQILIPDNSTAGTNLAASKVYYYFAGTVADPTPGWRLLGDSATIVNDDVLYPDTYFLVRNNSAAATSVTFMGTVHMGKVATAIGTISPNIAQDNAVALPVASDLTLAQTKLFESGAFVASTGHTGPTRKDQLLLWDTGASAKNRAADRIYYYFAGTVADPTPGWRLLGDSATIRDNEIVVSQTTGAVIRKAATPTPSSSIWSFNPPYVP